MFAYFKGILTKKKNDIVVIETGGVGYLINYPEGLLGELPATGEETVIHVYTSVSQDGIALYGFPTEDALDLFKLLISVSGVGPKAGMALLSVLEPDRIRAAILKGDTKELSKAKGVSAKTAQRIIVDLAGKDEIKNFIIPGNISEDVKAEAEGLMEGSAAFDAADALAALGYGRKESEKAVRSALKDLGADAGSDELLKRSLRYLL